MKKFGVVFIEEEIEFLIKIFEKFVEVRDRQKSLYDELKEATERVLK